MQKVGRFPLVSLFFSPDLSKVSRLTCIHIPVQIFMELYVNISEMYYMLEEDEEMVHPLQIASLLVDWMDPQKAM
jgi:hypothetical protein